MFRELINLGRKEREREIARKYTAGAIVGTLVGLTAGILLAPKSGKDTRKDIADAAELGLNKAGDAINDAGVTVRKFAEDTVDTIQSKSIDLKNTVKDKYESLAERKMIDITDIKEKAEDIEEKVKEKAEDVKDKAEKNLKK